MNNVSSKAAIGPGECFDYAPTISNVGNISGYVCFKIRQPFIVEEDTPLYVLNINKPWIILKDYILDDGFISIFTYPDPLQPGQSTIPIFKKIQMSPIPIPSYAKLDDINIAITMYASDSGDFSSIQFYIILALISEIKINGNNHDIRINCIC